MNEHMKPPRAGTAHNFGRRDNIRAGSVSGPWRSTPGERASVPSPTDPPPVKRADTPVQRSVRTPNAAPRTDERTSDHSERSAAPASQAQEAFTREASEEATAEAAVAERSRGRGRSRGRATLLPAVIGGSLAALAIVGGAVYLRAELSRPEIAQEVVALAPAPETTTPVRDTPAPRPANSADANASAVEIGDSAAGLAAAEEPAGAPAAPLRLRVGEGFPEDERLEIIAHLKAAGHAKVLVEEIPFPIALSRVGYYQSEDLPAAEALASNIAPLVGVAEGEVAVRDYGNLLPDAQPGRLDLWIKSP